MMKFLLFPILLGLSGTAVFSQESVVQNLVSTAVPSTSLVPMQAPQPPAPPRISYNRVKDAGPVLALTFDDGPHPIFTPRLLDTLADRKVKATFCVVGKNVELYPEIMKRIVDEGHEVANHSWSHPPFTKISDEEVRSQLSRTQNAILATTGKRAVLMRPPYAAITEQQRQWIHEEFGVKILMWSVEAMDWRKPGAEVVARGLIEGAAPGTILLAHDVHEGTIEAVPAVIEGVQAKGLRFVTVSELIALENTVPSL